MTGAFQIAKVFDIPVKLHWTFGLLVLYVGGMSYQQSFSAEEFSYYFTFIFFVFFSVLLHEFGHALTAKKYNVKTEDIILSPIGGAARLEKLPEKPLEEFFVALAGPAVNFGIVLLLLPYFYFYPDPNFIEETLTGRFLQHTIDIVPGLIFMNLLLGAFNLIPAFPMDGGRIMRALLSLKFSRLNATKTASYVGQAFGFCCILIALNGGVNWVYGLFGVFILGGARREFEDAKVEEVLLRNSVSDILKPTYTKLIFTDKMEVASNFLKQNSEKNFLVFDEDNFSLVGSISEQSITNAIKSNDLETKIVAYTQQSQIPAVYWSDNLKTVYEKLYEYKHTILPVLKEGQIIGVVNDDLMDKFLKEQRRRK